MQIFLLFLSNEAQDKPRVCFFFILLLQCVRSPSVLPQPRGNWSATLPLSSFSPRSPSPHGAGYSSPPSEHRRQGGRGQNTHRSFVDLNRKEKVMKQMTIKLTSSRKKTRRKSVVDFSRRLQGGQTHFHRGPHQPDGRPHGARCIF